MTDEFADLARTVAVSLGLRDARVVVVPHPIGTIDAVELADRVAGAVDDVVQHLFEPKGR